MPVLSCFISTESQNYYLFVTSNYDQVSDIMSPRMSFLIRISYFSFSLKEIAIIGSKRLLGACMSSIEGSVITRNG